MLHECEDTPSLKLSFLTISLLLRFVTSSRSRVGIGGIGGIVVENKLIYEIDQKWSKVRLRSTVISGLY